MSLHKLFNQSLGIDIDKGAESVILAISGFSQSEKYGLQRLFRALGKILLSQQVLHHLNAIFLGITLAPVFTRRSTHLLCPSGTGQKFDKAHEWDIPVVGLQWLSTITTSGVIPPVNDFIVSGPITSGKDLKGKGKAVDNRKGREASCDMDVDINNRMNDITNNSAFPLHDLCAWTLIKRKPQSR